MANIPATNSNLIPVCYDNNVADGETCEASILVNAAALAEIAQIKSIPGKTKRVKDPASGSLIQSVFDIIPNRPTYTKAQARLAFADLIANKPGAGLCEGACPEQFMVQNLDAAAGIAWSGDDAFNETSLPAPGAQAGGIQRPDIRVFGNPSFSGLLGTLDLPDNTWVQGGTSPTPTGSTTYVDGGIAVAPGPVIIQCRSHPGTAKTYCVLGNDGKSLPAQPTGELKVNDKFTLTIAGGATKEFTVKTGISWKMAANAAADPPGWLIELWGTDEGELYLKRALVVGSTHGSSYWLEMKLGSTVVAEERVEDGFFNSNFGTVATFQESCIAGYKV